MALSLGGGKNKSKSKQTIDQTQTNTLSDRAYGTLTSGMADLQGRRYRAFDPASIAQFQNPYTRDVIDASLVQADAADGKAWAGLDSRLAQSGAFGDKRRGILEAELAGTQSRDRASLIAGLNDQAFRTAMGAAMGENQNANDYDLQIQQLLNQLRGGLLNEGTSRTQGTQTGQTRGSSMNLGFSYGGG